MVDALRSHGVVIPVPYSVQIEDTIVPEQIAPGVVLHAGTRLSGASTSIGPGCEIGAEAPMTVRDCQLGHGVSLNGGFAQGGVFLDGASMGSGAHVRPGTLLEEQASGAHTVGFKQTILLSYVTAGSLINFCDALMAGGTSRRNHSEIGSSYIHFNFTPHGDKATPSLIGDVPRGVLLDQPPIFLGGQGGIVGPVRVAFGVVVAAGGILRKDALRPGELYLPHRPESAQSRPYPLAQFGLIDRMVRNNLIYIGNICALRNWYAQARRHTATDSYRQACVEGALRQLDAVGRERVKRLAQLADLMPTSIEQLSASGNASTAVTQQQKFHARWPAMQEALAQAWAAPADGPDRDTFLTEWTALSAPAHIDAVGALSPAARSAATRWLQGVVDRFERIAAYEEQENG